VTPFSATSSRKRAPQRPRRREPLASGGIVDHVPSTGVPGLTFDQLHKEDPTSVYVERIGTGGSGSPGAGGKKPTLGLGDRPDGRGRGTAPQGASGLATGRRRGVLRRDRGPSPDLRELLRPARHLGQADMVTTQQKNLIRQ
jgi:hypothetical protein